MKRRNAGEEDRAIDKKARQLGAKALNALRTPEGELDDMAPIALRYAVTFLDERLRERRPPIKREVGG